MKPIVHAVTYLKNVFDIASRKKIIRYAVAQLREVRETVPFDAIAFRGLSGAILAPAIADKLGVGIIAIRKPTEQSHSFQKVEGYRNCKYIIVDDLISSGATIRIIQDTIYNHHCDRSECLGVWLYNPNGGTARDEIEDKKGIPPILNGEDW